MHAPVGITAFAAYLPVLRLDRAAIAAAHAWAVPSLKALAHGRRTMAAWDEDVVTMAVEASMAALEMSPGPVDQLTLASSSAPFADRLNAGIVAAALDLDRSVAAQDATGSQRAATSALIALLARGDANALLVAAEHRRAKPGSASEMTSASGAAALRVGSGEVLAEFLGSASETSDFVDHYRAAAENSDYVLEERWVRDEAALGFVPSVVARALAAAGVTAAQVTTTVLAMPTLALANAAGKALGVGSRTVRDALSADCGLAGVAHPLLMLVEALEVARPGQVILLVGFGSGCDALVFRVTDAIAHVSPARPVSTQLAEGRAETNYMRFLSFTGGVQYDWGIRAERDNRTAQTVAWRKSRDVYAFVGGKCAMCGAVQFPRSRACVNPNCREIDTQQPFPLSRSIGKLKTFTEDWQASTPDPPLRYGNVGFAEGGNALMEIADCPPEGLSIGQSARMAFRIKDYDERRGFRRYFWKAVPLDQVAGDAGEAP